MNANTNIETNEGAPSRRKMSPLRKMVGRVLVSSKQSIPHFYVKETVDAAPLCAFQLREKAKYPCTLNDVIVMACAGVLMKYPMFRSRIEGDEIVTLPSANIGIAVGLDDGIVVPVLVNADRMGLEEIAGQSKRIVEKARKGSVEGMGKGVFTISNLGMFGTPEFSAIINPPEAAILAVGAARESAVVRNGELSVGKTMTLTLSVDHRIVDGVLAAKFLRDLKGMLESLPLE
jgi:pyruvate dehydrogenase E2 component (dihydrolipoamide acetyltransferase)